MKKIFISYSHKDRVWLDRLNTFLKPLTRTINIEIWEDSRINPGDDWREEIEVSLYDAQIAVLLVTPNFLASDFIANEELPKIFSNAAKNGLPIVWLSISHCLYEETELSKYQAANSPSNPIDCLPMHEQNLIFVHICQKIKKIVLGENKVITSELSIQPEKSTSNDKESTKETKLFDREEIKANTGTVMIKKIPSEWSNEFACFDVFCDGNNIGHVCNGKPFMVELPVGKHNFKVSYEYEEDYGLETLHSNYQSGESEIFYTTIDSGVNTFICGYERIATTFFGLAKVRAGHKLFINHL
jgi:hypothetical protein